MILAVRLMSNNENVTRFGLSIGVKFSPLAVKRNRLKRQLRAGASQMIPALVKGFDIVIMANNSQKTDYSSLEIKNDMAEILERARLINKKLQK